MTISFITYIVIMDDIRGISLCVAHILLHICPRNGWEKTRSSKIAPHTMVKSRSDKLQERMHSCVLLDNSYKKLKSPELFNKH